MSAPRFTMVVLLVADLARSVAFYRRLGVVFPPDVEARRDVVVDIGGGHNIVISETFGSYLPDRAPPAGDARTLREFFVPSEAEVDAAWADLTGAGYRGRRAPFTTAFDAYMCLVDDPDGTTVLVTAG